MAGRRKRKKSKTTILGVIGIILVVIAAIALVALVVLQHYYNTSNYIPDEKVTLDAAYLEELRAGEIVEEGETAEIVTLEADLEEEVLRQIEVAIRSVTVVDKKLAPNQVVVGGIQDNAKETESQTGEVIAVADNGKPEGEGQEGLVQEEGQAVETAAGNVGGEGIAADTVPGAGDGAGAGIQAGDGAGMGPGTGDGAGAAAPAPVPAPMTVSSNGTMNILLIGADRRNSSWYGNSDSMILVTINNNKGVLYVTSFMRDLYANIPGVGAYKLNRAYALGGGPLLMATLRANYGVQIDYYAAVDFGSMAGIIDSMGGVNVYVDAAEAAYLKIGQTGNVHMNGSTAVAYSRIRYVGQWDYERTARQREILTSLYHTMRGFGVTEWPSRAAQILPYITHNMDGGTVASCIASAPSWINYSLVELRVPFDGHFSSSNEILIPDFSYTIPTLLGTIYN